MNSRVQLDKYNKTKYSIVIWLRTDDGSDLSRSLVDWKLVLSVTSPTCSCLWSGLPSVIGKLFSWRPSPRCTVEPVQGTVTARVSVWLPQLESLGLEVWWDRKIIRYRRILKGYSDCLFTGCVRRCIVHHFCWCRCGGGHLLLDSQVLRILWGQWVIVVCLSTIR